MDASVHWKHGLSFEGSTAGEGSVLRLESKAGEPGGSFTPMELLLVGLAGCTAMDVISILEKKRQQVTAFDVLAHGERADEHPKVFTSIALEYRVAGRGIDRSAVEHAVELSETKYCSAMAMLRKAASISRTITVLEEAL